ncbi:MAG TPA: c-type cytochrome [bacterium]|nr:c-type cytochrome [bacterium]HPM60208.1 c-type cytochrome [bacterium]
MDFPIFHLDFIGNRMLIAITAIVHVIINHPMAVGAIPMATLLEWIAHRKKWSALDDLAYKITFVFFVITTSLGAMTGVGIWFTTALVNPDAIGSLIRVFFWAWFSEWVVFFLEVVFIMLYFLTWKPWSGEKKRLHLGVGLFLSIFSWLTMAVITGILGFMMNTGKWVPFSYEWVPESSMFTAFFNPLYLPQLIFRTAVAFLGAGLFFLFLIPFFKKLTAEVRGRAVRPISLWVLAWLPVAIAGAIFYWQRIPVYMQANAPVALATQDFTRWYQTILWFLLGMAAIVPLAALWGVVKPKRLPAAALVIPFIAVATLLGTFERLREFVRKPWVIQGYLYANGLRAQDYPLFKEEGVLSRATWVRHHQVTEENKLEAGGELFMLTCSRCHTVGGVNSVRTRFQKLFPVQKWDEEQLAAYISTMHNIRIFMPPFPGSDAELKALSAWLAANQHYAMRAEGGQTALLPSAPVLK